MRQYGEQMSRKTGGASLYSRLGGEEAIQNAVVDFYARVMCDPRLEPFFEKLDMGAQIHKQIAFMTMAFGGPHKYTGQSLAEAHAGSIARGMTDEHFDLVVGHLSETLREIGIDADASKEVLELVESMREAVMGRA